MFDLTSSEQSAALAERDFTPRQLVAELDRHIVGQQAAKRAVAIAIRNRWRRRQLADDIRQDVSPKNILMIGPTGVGKTEIARRLAKLTGAPFVKVEATKYTEVGYYGRDVESMVRDLVENAIGLVRARERTRVQDQARQRAEERLLDLLAPPPLAAEADDRATAREHYQRTRERMRGMLRAGELEDRRVEVKVEDKPKAMFLPGMGMEHMDLDLQGMFDKLIPRSASRRELAVSEARQALFDQECDALLEPERVNAQGVELAENMGIIFIDEMDKIVAGDSRGADVSRQGVQRDLLPIVEGTTVQTRYGHVRTDHVLFIAAGAFHRSKPSELMPELQGRFPLRVELQDLTKDDFVRILTEPMNSLTRQYAELLRTEGVQVEFSADAIEELAQCAFQVNQNTQNIGARRLYTILERLLEELSFEAADMGQGSVTINAAYVRQRLAEVADNEDLSRFIL